MNSKMIGRLLLVFCAVGLSRPEHFLVETEASGEDYASAEMRKVLRARDIQHKKSDGGNRNLDTGDQIAEYIDSIKSNLPKDVKDIGKLIGKQIWKEIVEIFEIIKSNLPKSISEMLPNTGAEYFEIIKSKLPIIKSNLPKLKSFLTSGNIGSLFDIAELAWPEMKALPIRDIVERTWGQLLPVLKEVPAVGRKLKPTLFEIIKKVLGKGKISDDDILKWGRATESKVKPLATKAFDNFLAAPLEEIPKTLDDLNDKDYAVNPLRLNPWVQKIFDFHSKMKAERGLVDDIDSFAEPANRQVA